MADQFELEGVIEDAVNDATTPEQTEYTETTEATDGVADTTVDTTAETTEEVSSQAPAPGAVTQEEAKDDFADRYGIQPNSVTGRENRIPYSRVKKIVERAEKEAIAKAKKEAEGGFAPRVTELDAKVKDYEGRLQKVAEFENMIETQPQQFLDFLSTLPAYKEFFTYIQQLAAQAQSPQQQDQSYLDTSTMPQPDERLADGSMVYSLKGLAARDEWLAKQVEAKAIRAAEERLSKRYDPIEKQWQAEQRRAQAIPIIQKQIAEARQWPHFTEHEAEIIEALKADANLSLDGAYRQVLQKTVLPKIQADRDTMRKEILEELKKKPVSTAAPVHQTKPVAEKPGKKSLEEIIAEAAATLKK
jgi:hypothetical protein